MERSYQMNNVVHYAAGSPFIPGHTFMIHTGPS